MSNATPKTARKVTWFIATKRRAEELLEQGQISITAYAVLMRLASWADRDGRNVRPKQETVAKAIYMSVSTVERALKELRTNELLELVQPARGGPSGGRAAVYKFVLETETSGKTSGKTSGISDDLPSNTEKQLVGEPRRTTRHPSSTTAVSKPRKVRPPRNTTRDWTVEDYEDGRCQFTDLSSDLQTEFNYRVIHENE